jgi:Pathogenicity locus
LNEEIQMAKRTRKLSNLRSVGPAIIEDSRRLGITRVEQLKGRDPKKLYDKICQITGIKHDNCVLDVFRCAIAQAEDPDLHAAQRDWFYWSRVRKRGK